MNNKYKWDSVKNLENRERRKEKEGKGKEERKKKREGDLLCPIRSRFELERRQQMSLNTGPKTREIERRKKEERRRKEEERRRER